MTLNLPEFDDLPSFQNFKGCAWGIWGPQDQLGTVNMLTEDLVKQAATEEVVTGQAVSLNWPLNFPAKPLFGRMPPQIIMKPNATGSGKRDDEIHISTQSGTQWNGLRHLGILEHGVFYNNTHKDTLPSGIATMTDIERDEKYGWIGIQKWAEHGISGRGVLLDLVPQLASLSNFDPCASHPITVQDLKSCAEKQGVQFRTGDILLIRMGFIRKYNQCSQEERDSLPDSPPAFAGLEQSEDMLRFLWNNHFAACATDQPTLGMILASSSRTQAILHQGEIFKFYADDSIDFLRRLWGMPIGELFDLERLAEVCAQSGRYAFFFSSWPLHIIGGCASPANAAAYF